MERLPKAVLFDLDDTLLWDHKSISAAFQSTCRIAEERFGIDSQQLEAAVRKRARALYESYDIYPFVLQIGINPFEGLWGTFDDPGPSFQRLKKIAPDYQREAWTDGLRSCGVEDAEFGQFLARRFPEERKKHPYLFEDTLSVLGKLKGIVQLVLVTNGSPSLQRTKLSLTPELYPFFEAIVISGEVGKGKPDPAMFHCALESAGIEAEDALMVGDNLLTDILGAKRTGIPSVWINHWGRKAEAVQPEYEIASLAELLPLLGL